VTFKSHQEALDDWALKELTGHYVNYRKQVSPSLEKLLPEEEFRLYAVCSRHPSQLAGLAGWRRLQDGVYECSRGSDVIRIVVLRQLPREERNAPLHLLSATPELVAYGASHYRQRSPDTSTLIHRLFTGLEREDIAVPYTMKDFRRDYAKELFNELTPAQRRELIKKLSPKELSQIEKELKRSKEKNSPRETKKESLAWKTSLTPFPFSGRIHGESQPRGTSKRSILSSTLRSTMRALKSRCRHVASAAPSRAPIVFPAVALTSVESRIIPPLAPVGTFTAVLAERLFHGWGAGGMRAGCATGRDTPAYPPAAAGRSLPSSRRP